MISSLQANKKLSKKEVQDYKDGVKQESKNEKSPNKLSKNVVNHDTFF